MSGYGNGYICTGSRLWCGTDWAVDYTCYPADGGPPDGSASSAGTASSDASDASGDGGGPGTDGGDGGGLGPNGGDGGAHADGGSLVDSGPIDSGSDDAGSTDAATADGGCSAVSSETLAIHVKLDVSWAASVGLDSSTGRTIDLWYILALDYSGPSLSGSGKACGMTLPSIPLEPTLGNEQVDYSFADDTIWDKHTIFPFTVTGTQNGTSTGNSFSTAPAPAIAGIATTSTYASLTTTWPTPNAQSATLNSYPQFTASDLSDDDGDQAPGLTLSASNASPYSYMPTNVDYMSDFASSVDFVFREKFSLSGTRGSCGSATGTASVSVFEDHVVGCVDAAGSITKNCVNYTSVSTAGPGYVDLNRPEYVPGSATFTAARVASTASCAAVRAATP